MQQCKVFVGDGNGGDLCAPEGDEGRRGGGFRGWKGARRRWVLEW